jgi:hypothetical protein
MSRHRTIVIDDTRSDFKVSDDGDIINKITGIKVEPYWLNGYLQVTIKDPNNGTKRSFGVSRLVAFAFIPNDDDKKIYVNHKSGDTSDNSVTNLEWVTQKRNAQHALETGLTKPHSRPVKQYTLKGKFIKKHKSIEKIAKKLGVTRHAIIRVCKGKNKTCCGFLWKYATADDNDTDEEEMEDIDGYPNYAICESGRVYSKYTKKFLKPMRNAQGAEYVTLCNKGKKKNFYINVLVADAFIPNPDNKKYVRHINGILHDNRLENLKRT